MDNVVIASFTRDKTKTRPVYQWDYGLELHIVGGVLPDVFEVHFSNDPKGNAKTQIGQNRVVSIPDEFLISGRPVYAWIFLHHEEDDGRTVFPIEIPVIQRAQPSDTPPTPQQQSVITETIAALQSAVVDAEGLASDAHGYAVSAGSSAESASISAGNAADSETAAQGYAASAQAALNTILSAGLSATDDGNGNVTLFLEVNNNA